MSKTDEVKTKQDFQKEWKHDVRNYGTRKAIDRMYEHNSRMDAVKERSRKTLVEQQVSNTYLSGVRGGFSFPNSPFEKSVEEVQRNAGRRIYVVLPDGSIIEKGKRNG